MRISFLGSSFTARRAQAMNSVFIEVGTGQSFVFDLGSGTITQYTAMGIPSSRMTRVFLTHLHADHMSDLVALYCFGPAHDRKTPLHIYGPSGPILRGAEYTEQGTQAFCKNLLALCRWHSDAMSFLSTGLKRTDTSPPVDGYEIVPHELRYRQEPGRRLQRRRRGHHATSPPRTTGTARSATSSSSTACRVVFSGDTKPTDWMYQNAKGVDVLIHEMALSVERLGQPPGGLLPGDRPDDVRAGLRADGEVQANSHTPEKAFGRVHGPVQARLGVITHCHFNQDTFIPAITTVRKSYEGPLAWAIDGMVLNLRARRADHAAAWRSPPTSPGTSRPRDTQPSEVADAQVPTGPYAQFSDYTMRHILPGYKP